MVIFYNFQRIDIVTIVKDMFCRKNDTLHSDLGGCGVFKYDLLQNGQGFIVTVSIFKVHDCTPISSRCVISLINI